VANLTQVACGFAQPVTTRLTAGTTYYFQVGSVGQSGGPILFNLAVAPPPQVGLIFFPSDPSTFDNVQFMPGVRSGGRRVHQYLDVRGRRYFDRTVPNP
jgi:hypothetical protein